MTARLTLTAPATIAVLAGSGAESSLFNIPPGIAVSGGPSAGAITLQVSAANSTATLSAPSAGGTVSGGGDLLTIIGTQAQVNAALAGFQDDETGSALTDTLLITATNPSLLYGEAAIGVNIYPTIGPAFVTPPSMLNITANTLASIPLLLGDPEASGLGAVGAGQSDTLTLTLSVGTGLLLLAAPTALSAVEVNGEASNALSLTFTADALDDANALLNSLDYVGPAGKIGLAYVARNISGPVATTLTHGIITLTVAGTVSPASLVTNGETVLLSAESLIGSVFAGTTGGLAKLTAGAAVIAPDADLNLPVSALSLTGSTLDYGTISAASLVQSGPLLVGDGFTLGGPVFMAAGAVTDFSGSYVAGNNEANDYVMELSLAAGADLAGGGELTAGNFSESGLITGPGTITALSGQTLGIVAGSIAGGVVLQADAGAVVVLGPLSPLYGVFDYTPLSISNSVILDFNGTAAVNRITGIYADSLAETGGAFVLYGPESFGGTIENFLPGDALIFPGLSYANVANQQSNGSFSVIGVNSYGSTTTYGLFAASPTNPTTFFTALDAEGDFEVLARQATASVNLPLAGLAAGASTPQPILGLSLNLVQATTSSLRLTLNAGNGVLSTSGLAAAASLTLTAANVTAMDALLAGISYTGNGATDELTIIGSGVLAGLDEAVYIASAAGQVANGYGGGSGAESQIDSFAANGGLQFLSQPFTPGRAWVMGDLDFSGPMLSDGVSGIALQVDGSGTAIFDASAAASFGADVVVGDAGGAGTLAVITQAFTTAGNVTIGGNAAASGSAAEIMGRFGAAGALSVGAGASAMLNLAGTLTAAATSLGTGGTLLAYGAASASLGPMTDNGAVSLLNTATINTSGLVLGGTLLLGGTALFNDSGGVFMTGGELAIGRDGRLVASFLTESGGMILDTGTLDIQGSMSLDDVSLSGGSIIAAALGLAAGGTVMGNGFVEATSLPQGSKIIASGGRLIMDAPLSNAGLMEIDAGATLEAVSTLSSEQITFNGASAALVVDNPALLAGEISGLVGSDVIDLRGVAPADVDYLNHEVTIYDTLQNQLTNFLIYAQAGQLAPEVNADGQGGTLLTLDAEFPCFARGTRLLTPHGYRAVEFLAPGDPVVTATGARRAVRWIGRRVIDLGRSFGCDAFPVTISPHAFGPGKPARAVKLSPSHAVYAQGVLVPAMHLVNGATITQAKKPAAVTYYHIELDRHDLLLADGLPCESYFDAGNRGALYQEQGIRTPARRPYARLVTSGAKLAKIRQRLHEIALSNGFSLTYQPRLRLAGPGVAAVPEVVMRRGRRVVSFATSLPAGEVALLSSTASPADTDPFSEDRRELGVCLGDSGIAELGDGWLPRAPHDTGIWMGAQAGLLIPPGSEGLTLTLAAIIQSWVPPAASYRLTHDGR